MKCSCGYELKYNPKISLIYAFFGKKKRYIRCNQCQKTHCIRISYHIYRDNADSKLKTLNQYRTKQMGI